MSWSESEASLHYLHSQLSFMFTKIVLKNSKYPESSSSNVCLIKWPVIVNQDSVAVAVKCYFDHHLLITIDFPKIINYNV